MFNHPIGTNKAKKPMAKAPSMPAEDQQGQEMAQEGGEEQDGNAIASQHGPATMVAMEHEHEMGAHHVHSMHPDGHEHHSDHPSAEAAHEHGKKLAGVGGKDEYASGGEEESEPWGKE